VFWVWFFVVKLWSGLMNALMSSLLALLEGRAEEAVRVMEAADTTRDPKILLYFARHFSNCGGWIRLYER
jgi:hypothetical protein